MLIFLSLITFCFSLYGSEEVWTKTQWEAIPSAFQVEKPSPLFKISKIDKKMLCSKSNPLERNTYINHTYHLIGKELSKCIGFKKPFGNWYYFASWASKSAGEIISGSRFNSLNAWQDFWVSILQMTKVLQTQKELQFIFGTVNQMIAIEMIPLGKTFINYFCNEKPLEWSEFEKLMLSSRPEERMLKNAFYHYYLAIKEQDINLKKEHTTLAATLQVISEQKRVDRPIKNVFNARGPKPLKHLIQKRCTDIGSYKISSGDTLTQISLGKDIQKIDIDKDLKNIELSELLALYKEENTLGTKGELFIKDTACQNWGNFSQRKKFLTAMFWVYINKTDLLTTPEKKYSNILDIKTWNEYIQNSTY